MTSAAPASGARGAPSLRDAFDPRRNSFDILRLVFAGVVGAAHGSSIRTGWQPSWGGATLGDFALDGFFVLSGFLVARSFLGLGSLPRYTWHRFLRIMPGFWVCLLVTALVAAPVAAHLQGLGAGAAFTGEPSAWHFLVGNAGLFITEYDIGGILADRPQYAFNGSLWTLAFEAFCYAVVAALGVLGLLRARRGGVLALAGGLAVLTVAKEAGLPLLDSEISGRLLRLLFVFVLGAVAHVYAERIPMRGRLAVLAVVAVLVSGLVFDDYRVLGAVPLAYAYLWFATCSPWPWSMRSDLSYGMYIYHYPVFQVLALTTLGGLPTPVFVVLGLAVSLGPAALSWYLVERPALAHKHSTIPDRIARALTPWAGSGRHRA